MSLLLRKACQPTLDEARLGNYHIGIDSGSKCMQILGECNKPLISIFGITFNRTSPTGAEIEYATELLAAFLSTHKVELDKYINLLRKFTNHPKIAEKTDTITIQSYSRWNSKTQNNEELFIYLWKPGYINYKLNEKGTEFFADSIDGKKVTMKQVQQHNPSLAEYKAAMIYCKNYKKYISYRDQLDLLRISLSSCDI